MDTRHRFLVHESISDNIRNALLNLMDSLYEVPITKDRDWSTVVLLSGLEALEREHDYSRQFILLKEATEPDLAPNLPDNVTTTKHVNLVLNIATALNAEVPDRSYRYFGPPECDEVVLVVDDQRRNVESAWQLLGERYDLTVVTTFAQAVQAICERRFDFVLTDLMLPASCNNLNQEAVTKHGWQEQPLGLLLALQAARISCSEVVIATDGSHHEHPFIAALDPHIGIEMQLEDGSIHFMNLPSGPEGKDWTQAIHLLKNS